MASVQVPDLKKKNWSGTQELRPEGLKGIYSCAFYVLSNLFIMLKSLDKGITVLIPDFPPARSLYCLPAKSSSL